MRLQFDQQPDFLIPDEYRPGELLCVKQEVIMTDPDVGTWTLIPSDFVITDIGYDLDEDSPDKKPIPGICIVSKNSYEAYLSGAGGDNVEIFILGAENVRELCLKSYVKGAYDRAGLNEDIRNHAAKLRLGHAYEYERTAAVLTGLRIDQIRPPAQRLRATLSMPNMEDVSILPTRIRPNSLFT